MKKEVPIRNFIGNPYYVKNNRLKFVEKGKRFIISDEEYEEFLGKTNKEDFESIKIEKETFWALKDEKNVEWKRENKKKTEKRKRN